MVSAADERPTGSSTDLGGVSIVLVVAPEERALSESGIAEFSSRAESKAGSLGAAGVTMEPPSHSRGDGEDEEHEDVETDFTKIAVWTPEAAKARSEFIRELETWLEAEKEVHEEEITGMVADESALSEAGPELPGVSFEFAVIAVLTSDGRGLSEEVITGRAEIKSVSPWAETTESPVLSQEEEEDGKADEEVETPCSFSLCCNSSVCT